MGIHPRLISFYATNLIFGSVLISYLIYFGIRSYGALTIKSETPPSFTGLFFYIGLIAFCYAFILPNFLKFSSASPNSEARFNLEAIYAAQQNYFSKTNTYASGPDAFQVLIWEPAGQTRYAYFCGNEEIENRLPGNHLAVVDLQKVEPKLSIQPGSFRAAFTCLAIGNIDNEDFLDVWMINNKKDLVLLRDDIRNLDREQIYLGKAPLLFHAWVWLLDHVLLVIPLPFIGLWTVMIIYYRRKFRRLRSSSARQESG